MEATSTAAPITVTDGAAHKIVVITAADDVRVVIDPKSVPIVSGSTLEFDTALLGGGLKVNNPQAVHGCACGESFSI